MPASYFRYVQLCDAPTVWPETLPERLAQARDDRMLPGDGELGVAALLEELPAGIPASLEAPIAALADLPPLERARIGLASVRSFLSRRDDDGARHSDAARTILVNTDPLLNL